MKHFTLMILCAGFGSRMLNLTRSTPKPLLKYKNKIASNINKELTKVYKKSKYEALTLLPREP